MQPDKQTDMKSGHGYRQPGLQSREPARLLDRHSDKQTNRLTDSQTDRQTGEWAERHTG